MQIGESVAIAVELADAGKCVICSKSHGEPKKADIKPVAPSNSGWKRKSMAGVFQSDGKRESVYPARLFPPPYAYQGHHCLALSSLVTDANTGSPKDRRIRLNFYLDQIGFFPNRPQNCIGLPARSGWGDFEAFFDAIRLNAPLQMHGPGHDESYFAQCDRLISSLISALTDPELCEEETDESWKDLLKERVANAENYAFNKLAENDGAWRLHPGEQVAALTLLFLDENRTMTVKGKGGLSEIRRGRGMKAKKVVFPKPKLDAGPFA